MRRRTRLILGLSVACGVAACARPHGEIAPLPVDPADYAGFTCPQLGQIHRKATRDLLLAEVVQDGYFAADRTRVFGAPIPMATLFGDGRAEEVARLKGETEAMAEQLRRGGCLAGPG